MPEEGTDRLNGEITPNVEHAEVTPADDEGDLPAAAESADADEVSPAELSPPELRALLTSILFTGGERIELERLQEYLGLDAAALRLLAEEAAGELRAIGLDILEAAGGLRLVSAAQWDGWISRFYRQLRKAKLGKSALEILAIIAYEQPVSRARVDELRQVNSESTVRSLLDRRLITVAGRADSPGRPFLYKTTDSFLEVFGLASLADLPPRPANLHSRERIEEGPFSAEAEEEEGILHIHGEVDE
jgi:segregation and condensation protein B